MVSVSQDPLHVTVPQPSLLKPLVWCRGLVASRTTSNLLGGVNAHAAAANGARNAAPQRGTQDARQGLSVYVVLLNANPIQELKRAGRGQDEPDANGVGDVGLRKRTVFPETE